MEKKGLIVQDNEVIRKSYRTLSNLLAKQPLLTIDSKGTFLSGFAKAFSQKGVDSITFYRGLSQKDFITLMP